MSKNKRFDVVLNEFDEIEYIADIIGCEDRDFVEFMDFVEELASENVMLKSIHMWYEDALGRLEEENKQLNEQVNRKQKHIVHLENKIHRMRENIKRLEVLYHYRGQDGSVDLKKECWMLKQEVGVLKGGLDESVEIIGELKKDNIHLEKENDKLRLRIIEKDRLLDDRDKIIFNVTKAINGDD